MRLNSSDPPCRQSSPSKTQSAETVVLVSSDDNCEPAAEPHAISAECTPPRAAEPSNEIPGVEDECRAPIRHDRCARCSRLRAARNLRIPPESICAAARPKLSTHRYALAPCTAASIFISIHHFLKRLPHGNAITNSTALLGNEGTKSAMHGRGATQNGTSAITIFLAVMSSDAQQQASTLYVVKFVPAFLCGLLRLQTCLSSFSAPLLASIHHSLSLPIRCLQLLR